MPCLVKICGVTSVADARTVSELGADAVGLNFYPRSPRCIDESLAAQILDVMPHSVTPVALSVDEPWQAALDRRHRLPAIQWLQVHGHELTPCPTDAPWVPAFSIKDSESVSAISAFLDRCRDAKAMPVAILVDAHVPGSFGGTGQVAPWHVLKGFDPGVPLILAGGLTPDNVANAVRAVRPWMVDVASGVESSPGRKDRGKVERFIAAVRGASGEPGACATVGVMTQRRRRDPTSRSRTWLAGRRTLEGSSPMSTHVFLLRHAETAAPTVFHGYESNIDLSERGIRQAEAIADALAEHQPELVVSSAMIRAHRTATAICRACDVPHEIEPDLHERKVGILSGQPFASNGIWAETSRRWAAGETSYAHDGAESLDQLRSRIVPAWERVMRRHRGKRLVVVAHGIVCKVLISNLVPGQSWGSLGSIRNVAIHELRHTGDAWSLERFGWLPEDFAERGLIDR